MGKKSDIEQIQDEAREGFSLRDRLAGVSQRRKTVTIYTDSAVGAELGSAEDQTDGLGLKTGRRVRKGLLGEMDALTERIEIELARAGTDKEAVAAVQADFDKAEAALKRKIKAAQKKLNETAMVFTLQALPDIIVRDARRKARKELGIKNKNIPEDKQEDYSLEYTAQVVAASVATWVDNLDGKTHTGLTVEQARDLRDLLPFGQFARLDHAVYELSFEAAIGNQATDSADF